MKILKIVAVSLIVIGLTSWLFFYFKEENTEQVVSNTWTVEQKNAEFLEEEFREINNKIDWVEKSIVSFEEELKALNEEKNRLLKEREKIQSEAKVLFDIREPWQITEDGSHQVMPTVSNTDDSHQKFKEMASAYWLDASQIWEVENYYGIKEWVILCITIAETSWWKKGAGKNNIGNVGNTDSNPRWQSYSNIWASLDAIGRTLTNGYIWPKKTLWCLSNAGSCSEQNDNGKRYASSDGNWERNMTSCLTTIYWEVNPSTFNIRR